MAWLKKRGKIWYVVYLEGGKEKACSLKTKNKKEAEKLLVDYREGRFSLSKKKITLGEFAPIHFAHTQAELSPRWIVEKKIMVKSRLIPFFGEHTPLMRIDNRAIEMYRAERLETVCNATINRELSCLMRLLRHAVKLGFLEAQYLPVFKKLRETRGRLRFLSTDEIERLLAAARAHPLGDALEAYINLMTFAGLRSGEALHQRWVDLDLERSRLTVVSYRDEDDMTGKPIEFTPKSHQNRTIPLIPRLQEYLQERRENSPVCQFIVRGAARLYFKRIFRSFSEIVQAAGLELTGENAVTAHVCRHTFASHLVMNGVSLYEVSRLLGHGSITITERYAHLAEEHLNETMRKITF
ncbi:MAG: site-specific integrase [Candidatus Omnitrophota bacterium]